MAENLWNREVRPEHPAGKPSGSVMEQATIGASVIIKGEVSGSEPLFIDGVVEGSVHFADHRVTVGRTARIRAEIRAREVVVMGTVEGNIYCSDLLDVRAEGSVKGHMTVERIRIDDGARLKGNIEVHAAKRGAEAERDFHGAAPPPSLAGTIERPAATPLEESAEDKFKESLLEAAASVSVAGGQPGRRVPGSKTLIEPRR